MYWTGPCACQDNAADNISTFYCTAWTQNPFPFGSEFAWDSTGQEEIYVWSKCAPAPWTAGKLLRVS